MVFYGNRDSPFQRVRAMNAACDDSVLVADGISLRSCSITLYTDAALEHQSRPCVSLCSGSDRGDANMSMSRRRALRQFDLKYDGFDYGPTISRGQLRRLDNEWSPDSVCVQTVEMFLPGSWPLDSRSFLPVAGDQFNRAVSNVAAESRRRRASRMSRSASRRSSCLRCGSGRDLSAESFDQR